MTTIPASTIAVTTMRPVHVRTVLRALRDTPAPHFEGGWAGKTRYVTYLLASMTAWTLFGIFGTGLLVAVVNLAA